tara:strand:+ start:751 stop:1380 length:630 start_codon:yes stop_codon:yes gene_type:complete
MEIDYKTKCLIVINYPVGSGGKFISLCLALADNVLHQDYYLANTKMQKKLNEKNSFDISSKVINKSLLGQHFELGCKEFAGFNMYNKEQQKELANDLWKKCTNQEEYYFFMMNNSTFNGWEDYPNAKHIILKNYDWILKARNKKIPDAVDIKTFKNYVEFDMESCNDKVSFARSIDSMCDFLDLKIIDKDLLESLRLDFLKTFQLGFEK